MVKTINVIFDNKEYEFLKNIKAKEKLSWRKAILKYFEFYIIKSEKVEEPKEDIEVIPSEVLE